MENVRGSEFLHERFLTRLKVDVALLLRLREQGSFRAPPSPKLSASDRCRSATVLSSFDVFFGRSGECLLRVHRSWS